MVDDIDVGNIPSKELVSEKIGDHINYLILLEGLIYDRISRPKEVMHNGTTL